MTAEEAQAGESRTNGPISVPFPLAPRERHAGSRREPKLSFLLRLQLLRRIARVISLLALDYAGVAGAMFTALVIKMAIRGRLEPALAVQQTDRWVAFAYLMTVLVFARVGLYAGRYRRPGLAKIAGALFQVSVVSLLFALASGQRFSSYYIFYGSLLFATAYIAALRALHLRITAWLLEQGGYCRRMLLIGSASQLEAIAPSLDGSRPRVELVGYSSPSLGGENGSCLGRLEDLARVITAEGIQEVIIADSAFPREEVVQLVDLCHRSGVIVQVAPSTIDLLIERARFAPLEGVPLFTLRPPVFEGIDYAVKRIVDLALATVGLILLSPLLLVIAVAVKLSSRGPVIYHSVRPGLGGRPFRCFKFRTMHEQADQLQAELESQNEQTGALFKIRDDPRLTPVGRFLRRLSLDELPQLANVIRGEMSLVGPRPLPMRDFERLEEWHKKRYLVLPGVTGLWQISGRSELDFDDLVRLDFLYLERWSILLDISILLKTIPALLSKRGAF